MTLDEKVREWARAADEFADGHFPAIGIYNPDNEIRHRQIRDAEFARLARADAFEKSARAVERRAEERFNEYGTREHDTNACYYTGRSADEFETRDEEDEECATAIRDLAAAEKEMKT